MTIRAALAMEGPDGEHGTRWGSGEGQIAGFELLDAKGEPVRTVHTGDSVIFRFQFRTTQPIEKPVFAMGIHTIEGMHVTSPNARDAGYIPDLVDGDGHFDLRVDRLMLTPGIYDASASMSDYACLHMYDCRHRSFRFTVERGMPEEQDGVLSLGGEWGGLDVRGLP